MERVLECLITFWDFFSIFFCFSGKISLNFPAPFFLEKYPTLVKRKVLRRSCHRPYPYLRDQKRRKSERSRDISSVDGENSSSRRKDVLQRPCRRDLRVLVEQTENHRHDVSEEEQCQDVYDDVVNSRVDPPNEAVGNDVDAGRDNRRLVDEQDHLEEFDTDNVGQQAHAVLSKDGALPKCASSKTMDPMTL